jgi:APA family basic amino acid/polyamine antiporter
VFFWSTGGWHHATFVSGEAIEPQKTVPKAMLYATLIVTVFYLSIISAYMILLPSDIMGASNKVAGDAIASVFSQGGRLVSVAITISIFGTIGIYTMSAPRIYYAMAKDGIFFKFLAVVSEKYKTPHNAMLFQAALGYSFNIPLGIIYQNYHFCNLYGYHIYGIGILDNIYFQTKKSGIQRI